MKDMAPVDLRALKLEKIGPFSALLKGLLINPLINHVLPTGFLKWFLSKSKSPLMQECLKSPGSWMSMELSYDKHARPKDWVDFLALRWSAMPMALRNRRQIVSHVLAACMEHYAQYGKVHVLGIGAGPSRNLLSAVLLSGRRNFHATCIDLDSAAFDYGRKLWKEAGIAEDAVVFIQGDAAELTHQIPTRPHIVKLVGILEYLDDASLKRLLLVARECLQDGGMMLTHSIYPAHGVEKFMRRVFGLHLRYRSTERMQAALAEAGFGDFQVYAEPIGVYAVITAVKKDKS